MKPSAITDVPIVETTTIRAFAVRLVINHPNFALTAAELRRLFEAAIANHPVLDRLIRSTIDVTEIRE